MASLLRIDSLVKRFGGVMATDSLSLSVEERELRAIIGPNGAGKSTLVAQITGEIGSDGGRIFLDDRDIGALAPAARTRLGVARSYQVARVLSDLTVAENVVLAVQSAAGAIFRFWRPVARNAEAQRQAEAALRESGLDDRSDSLAGALSHGEKRLLELAMILAMRPRLLLLDEPMAGLGAGEAAQLVTRLARLKRQCGIVLIEHDMEAVFALADRITVLVAGRVLTTDTPEAVRADAAVHRAYLGDGNKLASRRDAPDQPALTELSMNETRHEEGVGHQ